MSDFETLDRPKVFNMEETLRTYDTIASGSLKAVLEKETNRRGMGVDILRNTVEMFKEDNPNNERLTKLLKILQYPGSDAELNLEKIIELIELVN